MTTKRPQAKTISVLAGAIRRTGFLAIATVLFASGLAVLAPAKKASAAACVKNYGSYGGSSGFTPFQLVGGIGSSLDSSVQSYDTEFTPKGTGYAYSIRASIVKSDCTDPGQSVDISIYKGGDGTIKAYAYDGNRTTPYAATTDYKNINSAFTPSPSGSTGLSLSSSALINSDNNTAVRFRLDISTSGWLKVSYFVGSGAEQVIGEFAIPASAVSFLGHDYGDFSLDLQRKGATTCSQVTGSANMDVRVLSGGTAAVPLTIYTADAQSNMYTCYAMVKSSFNATSKVATLAYDVAGASVPKGVKNDLNVLSDPGLPFVYSASLELGTSGDSPWPKQEFISSTSADQQLYFFAQNYNGSKTMAKGVIYPIAGGIFDMSSSDVDLKDVKMDVDGMAFKSLAHNLGALTKDKTFTLFVPYRDGDKSVGICPGASTLDTVTDKCDKVYYLADGMTKTSADSSTIPKGVNVKANKVKIGNTNFWRIDGLSGTGGFSSPAVAAAPATGAIQLITSNPIVAGLATLAVVGALAVLRRKYVPAVNK